MKLNPHHFPLTFSSVQFVKDWHLMLRVAGFVAADIVMLTVVTALGSSVRYSPHSIPDKERSDTVNVCKAGRQLCTGGNHAVNKHAKTFIVISIKHVQL